jgi:autophagy-related protein 33
MIPFTKSLKLPKTATDSPQGTSYTLSSLTIPTLLSLPTALTASTAYTYLVTASTPLLRSLAALSTTSFLTAYLLAPRAFKHPYLLWTSLLALSAGTFDFVYAFPTAVTAPIARSKAKGEEDRKGKRRMDMSYEVVGDSNSEGGISEDGVEEDVNGEEVRSAMVGFGSREKIRGWIAGVGFVVGLIGLWGDGAW